MKTINVKTKTKTYDIIIDRNLIQDYKRYINFEYNRVFLITNDNLTKIYPDFINSFENTVIIKDGEKFKNYATFEYITEKLLSQKIERKDVILVFGGGVTGDLGGFAASCVLRGVKLIQMPTTLLSQVDSSVGGKTGFNSKYGKNLIGAFYQPDLVLIYLNLLNTLPDREIKTGMGEVVKYAFIEKNCSNNPEIYLYDYLLNSFDYSDIIFKSCSLKSSVVEKDEKESGLRAVLNFGHTFAHGIETLTDYSKFTHGEAVAIGMKLAFELSLKLGKIDKEYYLSAFNLIDKFNLAPNYKLGLPKDKFINVMMSDKKVLKSKIRLVLPVSKGRVEIFDNITVEDIKTVL